jgi:hypothetical protein
VQAIGKSVSASWFSMTKKLNISLKDFIAEKRRKERKGAAASCAYSGPNFRLVVKEIEEGHVGLCSVSVIVCIPGDIQITPPTDVLCVKGNEYLIGCYTADRLGFVL